MTFSRVQSTADLITANCNCRTQATDSRKNVNNLRRQKKNDIFIFNNSKKNTVSKLRFANTSQKKTKNNCILSKIKSRKKPRSSKIFAVSVSNLRPRDLKHHVLASVPRAIENFLTSATNGKS